MTAPRKPEESMTDDIEARAREIVGPYAIGEEARRLRFDIAAALRAERERALTDAEQACIDRRMDEHNDWSQGFNAGCDECLNDIRALAAKPKEASDDK